MCSPHGQPVPVPHCAFRVGPSPSAAKSITVSTLSLLQCALGSRLCQCDRWEGFLTWESLFKGNQDHMRQCYGNWLDNLHVGGKTRQSSVDPTQWLHKVIDFINIKCHSNVIVAVEFQHRTWSITYTKTRWNLRIRKTSFLFMRQ